MTILFIVDNHTAPHVADLYNTFQDLGITTDGLEEYITNVNLGVALEKRPPSLPVPRPQVHVFSRGDVRVLRRAGTRDSLPSNEDKMEEEVVVVTGKEGEGDTAGEEEGESGEEGEEWEEIPGYLPPFPKTDKYKMTGSI